MRRVSFRKLTYRNVRVSYTCITASKNKGSSFFLNLRYENNLLKQNIAFKASKSLKGLYLATVIVFQNVNERKRDAS